MKKGLLFALLTVALIAAPASASVQNIKVSGDIDTYWLVRDQFDLGVPSSVDFYQNLLFTQTRLRVDADLTDNVSATVALINEKVWGEENIDATDDNDIDLNLAYVTLREMLYSPLTVVIGRQNFAFGNSFVIDSAGTNNNIADGGLNNVAEDFTKRTAQDAIRMTLDYNPLTIDLVASKISATIVSGRGTATTNFTDDDVDLFGVNTNYQLGDDLDTVIEAYFWAKIDQSVKNTAGDKADTVYMPGVHVSTNPIKGLSLSAEVAWQGGNRTDTDSVAATIDNVQRNALGAQVIANYMIPFEKSSKYNPVLTTVYTYVSGDSNPEEAAGVPTTGDGKDTFTGWDPMFENQAGGTIYNALFDLSNAHIVTIKAEASPMEDVTAWAQWDGIWVDKSAAATLETGGTCIGPDCLTLRQGDGSTLNPLVTSNLKVGDEVGVGVMYDYTEDVQFGASYNWFFPGNLFHNDNNDVASQALIHGIVNF